MRSAGFVGIERGTGAVIGNADHVKLRFPTTWLEEAEGSDQ